jgi:hypothetical protein
MKRIALTVATGLFVASFLCPGTPRAQQSEPAAKGLKLKDVEAQVVTLQAQVATLQTAVKEDFAVVASSGVLVRGSSSSVVSASNIGTGGYQVIFNKNVSGCAYVATIGDTDAGSAVPGEIWVAGLAGNADGVFVDTQDSTGAESNRPFHLSVSCP